MCSFLTFYALIGDVCLFFILKLTSTNMNDLWMFHNPRFFFPCESLKTNFPFAVLIFADEQLDLQLSFINFQSGWKVNLVLDISDLSR